MNVNAVDTHGYHEPITHQPYALNAKIHTGTRRGKTMQFKTLYTIQHPNRMNILFTTLADEAQTYSHNGYIIYETEKYHKKHGRE